MSDACAAYEVTHCLLDDTNPLGKGLGFYALAHGCHAHGKSEYAWAMLFLGT